jgi:hypothetical protein
LKAPFLPAALEIDFSFFSPPRRKGASGDRDVDASGVVAANVAASVAGLLPQLRLGLAVRLELQVRTEEAKANHILASFWTPSKVEAFRHRNLESRSRKPWKAKKSWWYKSFLNCKCLFSVDTGIDVMVFYLFSPKHLAKILAYFAQTSASFDENLIITLVFEKNVIFLDENRQKSHKQSS